MTMPRISKLALFIFIFCFSATNLTAQKAMQDYAAQWKKVEDFQKQGLTKSALQEVESIYTLAKKADNSTQIIKSLLFKINLRQNIQEDASEKSIDSLEKEIKIVNGPAKSILQSITAQMYWQYFQQNRYKIYQRTNTENFDKKDIATWTTDELNNKIGELYMSSLQDEEQLKQTALAPFDAIIIKGNVRNLRPTLFDLLAHRALDYFNNDERNISRPAYAFEINDKAAFAPVAEFTKHSFATKDSSSLHQKALVVFQKLLAFHQNDAVKDALIDVDIERLEFVYQYATHPDKDKLYLKALKYISNTFKDNPGSAQASFLIAQSIYNFALNENENKDSSTFSVIEAKQILDEIIKNYPESEGGINARNLLNQILHPEIFLTTEKINVPGTPFRTLVKYKNFDHLYLRLIPLTAKLKAYLKSDAENKSIFSKLIAENNIRNWRQELPVMNDYLSHSVEIKIDALPVGEYVLLGSRDKDFSLSKNPLAAQYFHVSDISFVNSGYQYFALNRTTGQPLAGAKIQVWGSKYDYARRDYKLTKEELLFADKNGFFKLSELPKENQKTRTDSRNVLLELTFKNDRLFLDDYQYSYYNYYNNGSEIQTYDNQNQFNKANAKIFLFTDRSIYRPGQIVYFKGIGVTKDWKSKKSMLLQSQDSIVVILNDANGERADSLKVVLNEFGSFNGKFTLPQNKMNGRFNLEVSTYSHSSISFSVEEYKRPKFYTDFEKAKESYRVGDTVSITGFAKAYAGNDIDGAAVTYRVTRVARFIYPWYFWGRRLPSVQPLEIAHGETTTDAEGRFIVRFTAIPDLSIDKNTDPVFDYEVEADITDLNGETRSGKITVPVGYKALNLQINLKNEEIINIDSFKTISISSKNLSGEIYPVKTDVKIYKLQPPQRLIRQRMWQAPDQFIFNKNEYIQLFPHDEYKDETNKKTWQKEGLVYSKSDSASLNSVFNISSSKLVQGWYVVEATAKDKYGQEVKDIKYFQLFDKNASSLPSPQYAWNVEEKMVAEPGETARFITGSSAKDVYLIQEIRTIREPMTMHLKTGGSREISRDTLNFIQLNNKKVFEYKITEADRGGFGVNEFFVKDNRFYTISNNIIVPWSNKDLDISFDTYRDKVLPGSEEKWTVKIAGYRGQKVAAEMLASMYDASLDQFQPQSWSKPNIWPEYNGYNNWQAKQNFTTVNSFEKYWDERNFIQLPKIYDALNYIPQNSYRITLRGSTSVMFDKAEGSAPMEREKSSELQSIVVEKILNGKVAGGDPIMDSASSSINQKLTPSIDQSQIQIRKNFNETAFFFPDLRTDKDGNIEFSFTMPEALTEWKLMTLAHTKDLAFGYAEKTIVTQKELMVQPNSPRFLREGDKIEFSAKIVNLDKKEVSGQAELQILNATTMNPVDGWFKNIFPVQHFTAAAGQSTVVNFSLEVPTNFNDAVVYRIVAKAGNASDGEEAAIPVVTNRMLVTESMPLPMRGTGTKQFTFEKLLNAGKSETLTNYGITVEYTTNPAWYAVQAIPYLIEYPYECSEQNFNRFYANALAMKIANSSPKIKTIFEKWKTLDTAALQSNLQKNEELKSVLLQETPWVLQAQSEAQQKKNIALLFDMVKMSQQLDATLDKLIQMQSSNGGFVWFKGGPDDRYVTQYIVTGIGHLKHLNAYPEAQKDKIKSILDKAIPYLDMRLKNDYDDLIKYKANLKNNQLSNIAIQFLYMRSFFPEYKIAAASQIAYTYYREQTQKYWLTQGKYMQGMIALSLNRTGDNKTAPGIIKSLQENAINNEELGMYWKEWDRPGYWWYQAPIESQALMIEAFSEISKDKNTVADLKTWLLKNKQTNNWKTTKATSEAVYALLLQGTDWLTEERNVIINLGNTTINSKDENQEAGTGYFRKRIEGDRVKPEMGNIKVTVSGNNSSSSSSKVSSTGLPGWGSVYWQYFENLDKITFAETPLKVSKKLFIEKNTDRGPVIIPINEGDKINIGDKIKVRIELRVDRDMEYVHMKDMRSSAMEPTNVISQYKWQGGLGYYETTKDVSTNFFFNYLNKGTYVFEYPMFVTHAGNFSNGITTIQSMYAPEFTAHSEGVRIEVKAKE